MSMQVDTSHKVTCITRLKQILMNEFRSHTKLNKELKFFLNSENVGLSNSFGDCNIVNYHGGEARSLPTMSGNFFKKTITSAVRCS